MKQFLLKTLKALFYPLLWCRQTILDASEVCGNYDPIGFSDCTNFVRPEVSGRVRPVYSFKSQSGPKTASAHRI